MAVLFGSNHWGRWLIILILGINIIFLSVKYGPLLKANIFSSASQITSQEGQPTESPELDDYTAQEAICRQEQENYIAAQCGHHALPDHDYACRTQEAETIFQACMQKIVAEDIERFQTSQLKASLP